MEIEKRLSKDIEVFTKEVAQLDVKASLAQTLAVLGITPPGNATSDTTGAGRNQRPAPAGESD